MSIQSETVVVAMSGGVDSSAVAFLLAEAGYNVIGVSMHLWKEVREKVSDAPVCQGQIGFEDARRVAQMLQIPYHVFDFEEQFFSSVVSPFMGSYIKGETPNPCVNCNRVFKFGALRERANSFDARFLATGHYATIKELATGELGLFPSTNLEKDQSYFLYSLTQDDLKTTLFPLGGKSKNEVREYLRCRGVEFANKGESQDICFMAGSVAEFIDRQNARLGKVVSLSGRIKHSNGQDLGEHDGIHRYTVGQRKGLGVGGFAEPLYVLRIDAEKREVIVGAKRELEHQGLIVQNVHWIAEKAVMGAVDKNGVLKANVKLRYRHQGVLCEIGGCEDGLVEGGRVKLSFCDKWSTVSPGQSAVFYAANSGAEPEILGGGIIERGV